MVTLPELSTIVATWCETQPRVTAAYLFGSRVKGTHRENSDLDVAVELVSPWGNPGNSCDWAELASQLKASLSVLLPVPLDLWQYQNPIETPTIHDGLLDASVQVYAHGPNQSFKRAAAPKYE